MLLATAQSRTHLDGETIGAKNNLIVIERGTAWHEFAENFSDKVYSLTSFPEKNVRILDQLRDKSRILIVGCGSEVHLQKAILEKFPEAKITAADLSPEMLCISQIKFQNLNLTHLLANTENLGLESEFDFAISTNSIIPPYRKQVIRIYKSIYRALKPGGRLIAYLPAFESVRDFVKKNSNAKIPIKIREKKMWDTEGWQCCHTVELIQNEMCEAGLQEINIKQIRAESQFEIDELRRLYGPEADEPFYIHFVTATKSPLPRAESSHIESGQTTDRDSTENGTIKKTIPTEEIKSFHELIPESTKAHPEKTLCFLNEKLLYQKARSLQRSFLPNYTNSHVAYAMKANSLDRILQILMIAGIDHFDCASVAEINKVIKNTEAVQLEPNRRIKNLFNHPVKMRTDISQAAKRGVSHFTVQSLQETKKTLQESEIAGLNMIEIAVRLKTENSKATIDLSSKYGAEPTEADEIFDFLKRLKGSMSVLPGISIHIGSQAKEPEAYATGIQLISDFLEKYHHFHSINLGGGLPVNYFSEDNYDLHNFFDVINDGVYEYLKQALGNQTKFFIEPGRAMVAEAVDLVIPVLARERRKNGDYIYINDGIFTSFSDFVIHDWRHALRFLRSDGSEISGGKQLCPIFGRTCDSGDHLGLREIPDELSENDFVWVPNAGAYLDAQSSTFHSFEAPQYISYNAIFD